MWKAIFLFSLYIIFYFISDRSTIIPQFNHKPTIKYPHSIYLVRRACSSSSSLLPSKTIATIFFVLRVAVFKISASVPRQATNNGRISSGTNLLEKSVPVQSSAIIKSPLCSYIRLLKFSVKKIM